MSYNKINRLKKAMEYGFILWQESLFDENRQWRNTCKLIYRKSQEYLPNENIIILGKISKYIEDLIKSHCIFYNKDEVILTLMIIKEYCRRRMLSREYNDVLKSEWHTINEYQISILLINILIKIDNEEFCGEGIEEYENGYSNLITVLSLSRVYLIIQNNIAILSAVRDNKVKELKLEDVLLSPIETYETENYFEDFIANGAVDKPEDYSFHNTALYNELKKLHKTPQAIISSLSEFLKKNVGFDVDDAYTFARRFSKNISKVPPISSIERKDMEPIQTALLNFFSINALISDNDQSMELRSAYTTSEGRFVFFGIFDLIQNISTLEKLLVSNHHLNYFCLDDVLVNSLQKELKRIKAQQKMATFLSYAVVDKLVNSNYIVPTQRINRIEIPQAEISKIKVSGLNILQNKGDLDVITVDKIRKKIIIIEIKYYQPSVNYTSMLLKDKSKIETDDVFRKMQERNEIIDKYSEDVIEFITGIRETGYIVESILMTARANFYTRNYTGSIKCLSWAELIELIEKQVL